MVRLFMEHPRLLGPDDDFDAAIDLLLLDAFQMLVR